MFIYVSLEAAALMKLIVLNKAIDFFFDPRFLLFSMRAPSHQTNLKNETDKSWLIKRFMLLHLTS